MVGVGGEKEGGSFFEQWMTMQKYLAYPQAENTCQQSAQTQIGYLYYLFPGLRDY